jgi:hypothetical protein
MNTNKKTTEHHSLSYSCEFVFIRGQIPFLMVGLGGLEPPTSSLSGMRSSQLSYRPKAKPTPARMPVLLTGGAGRDRTGDLLSANQALSQLSYSPSKLLELGVRGWGSGKPALPNPQLLAPNPCFQSRPVGYRNHESSPWPFGKTVEL